MTMHLRSCLTLAFCWAVIFSSAQTDGLKSEINARMKSYCNAVDERDADKNRNRS